jgi:hypothetical protein
VEMGQTPNGQGQSLVYRPSGPTIKAFHQSNAFVRGILGPIGSSKSSACCVEILRRAGEQTPGPDGIKRFRACIIRNTYGELRTTTLKTWHQWCPPGFGKITMDSPFVHHIKSNNLDLEVMFLALDREEDQKKILSLELTIAWVNECKEIPKAVIDTLTGRVGRYPSVTQGGATWYGIIMDTNACDTECWYYKMAEETRPEGWEFFKQPSARSPEAENLINLPKNYYKNLIAGKEEDWIKVYVDAEYAFLTEGKSVFPQYKDSYHCAKLAIEPIEALPLIIGADFGLTPAAVIAQVDVTGAVRIIDELTTDNTGIIRFAELLAQHVAVNYPNFQVRAGFGDPSGNQRAFSDEQTALDIMKKHTKWSWYPAPGDNTLGLRLESVRLALQRNIDGNAGFMISPKCRSLRKALVSGYHYKLSKSNNNAVVTEVPNKNEWSHIADALQYLMLGIGGGDAVLGRESSRRRRAQPTIDPRSGLPMRNAGGDMTDEMGRPMFARGVGGDIPGF